MNTLRRIIAILLCAVMFTGILTACGRRTGNADEPIDLSEIFYQSDFNKAQDYSAGFVKQASLAFETYFRTNNGIYFLDESKFINYYSFDAEKTVIVCSKPDCKHEPWDSSTLEDQRCDAYQYGDIGAGFTYKGQLYILVFDHSESTATIIRSELDRSNQHEVATIDTDYTAQVYVNDGIVYLPSNKYVYATNEEGVPESTDETYTWLSSVDLESGEVIEMTERVLNCNSELNMVCSTGEDSIYLEYTYFEKPYDGTNFKEAGPNYEFYEYNISTGKYNQLDFGLNAPIADFLAVEILNYNVAIFAERDEPGADSTIVEIDLETGEKKIICEAVSEYDVDLGAGTIHYTHKGTPYLYHISSGHAEKLDTINGFYIHTSAGNYFLGSDSEETGSGVKSNTMMISKNDYYSGAVNQIISIDRK